MSRLYLLLLLVFLVPVSSISAQENQTLHLIPSDDAFVIVDHKDPNDTRGYQTTNTGNLNYTRIWYANDISNSTNPVTTTFLKFDLNDYKADQIKSAALQMDVVFSYPTDDPKTVALFLANSTEWNESTLTYKNAPFWNNTVSKIQISSTGNYTWPITNTVKEHAGQDLSIVLFFETMKKQGEEVVSFSSKESGLDKPVLQIVLQDEPQKIDPNKVKIIPLDDTFVVSINDENNSLDDKNFGSKDFLKVWYSWNATGINERTLSLTYLKFNLTEINQDRIQSAQLKMYPYIVNLTNDTRQLNVYEVPDDNWSESEITYANAHEYDTDTFATAILSEQDRWYGWDVTDIIQEDTDDILSLLVTYQTLHQYSEENIAFNSKETMQDELRPYLEIQYEPAESEETNGGCLIATAAYGTELATPVQQLRELRDNTLLQTSSGKSFMESFNQFYYTFSPVIADYERQNPAFKEMVKLAITPMVASLSILNHADIDTEAEMIGYGTMIILLNGIMYGVLPAIAIIGIKKVLH